MTWNWQRANWPDFVWDVSRLSALEARFAEGMGIAIGTSRHLDAGDHQALSINILSTEAVDSSAIEGEQLDRDSVQSSIQRQLGLTTLRTRATPGETGIARMMVDLYQTNDGPLREQTLFDWHRLIMNGRVDLADIGAYRSDAEPMQIVSGALHAPKVHFEAPPAHQVAREMRGFLDWWQRTGQGGDHPLPAVTRSGIAHLWFESIHPFEDGNGRIGRAIAEKALAQGQATPILTGMAGTLLRNRKAYYQALEQASQTLHVTEWLVWFAGQAIAAQSHTLAQINLILAKSRLFARLEGQLNSRQEKGLLRLFAAGPEGFRGGLSAANYMAITGATTATTTRDLQGLVDMGALIRSGERKATRYRLPL